MKILLGLSGYAGAGKDSFADVLVARHSFTKMAFADPLREVAAAINPIVAVKWPLFLDGRSDEFDTPVRYNDALARIGYTEAKVYFPEIRELLQRIGTEAGRRIIKDSLWVDMAMERAAQHERVVIADMRFENEADAITDAGGFTIRITRPGMSAVNSHISEVALDEYAFDDEIMNVGALADLDAKVDYLIAQILAENE